MLSTLERPGGTLTFDVAGDGPLVVCVPGMGDLRGQYRFLAPRLAEAGFRVISLDLRGHGDSSTGFSDYSAAAIGADVLALANQPMVVIGNSMAGAAAIWAAAEAPARVRGIVLIDPFTRDIPATFVQRAAMALLFRRPWGPAAWAAYYRSLYPARKPPAEYVAALKANLKQKGRFEALQAMLRAKKAPCEARIPEVKAPSLVVMGTKDPDFQDPTAEANLVAERLKGEIFLVEGAGHYPHTELPEAAAPRIIEFVEKCHAA